MKKDIDRVWSEMESYEMLLTQRHMTGERQLIVVGKNNETSLFFFNQADLPTQVDYHVENDQSLPQDQAQRSTIVTQLMQTLAMTEDKGLRSMHIRLLGLTDFEHMAERLDPDQVKAERLVAKLLIGESEPVFEGDDPLIFKLELERLMKSEQYVKQVAAEIEEYGVSPLEQMSRVLWTHYTTAGSGQPMAPVPAEPGPVAPEPEAAPEEPIPGDVPVVSEDPVMEAA